MKTAYDTHHLSSKELESLIDFYDSAGIELVCPQNILKKLYIQGENAIPKEDTPKSVPQKGQPKTSRRAPAVKTKDPESQVATPSQSLMAAREKAAQAQTLSELRALMEAFDGCPLRLTAKNCVFLEGPPDADLLFIGEAPGRDEDVQGRPFVGRAGQLFEKMLAAIGLARTQVAITNTVPWRPPGNRPPSPEEIEICQPFLLRQIDLVNPRLAVFLGGVAAKSLLETTEGILKLRGRWHTITLPSGKKLPCLPTLHPAYLLRQPAQKRLSWQDLLKLQGAYEGGKR